MQYRVSSAVVAVIAAGVMFFGCGGQKVLIPPRIDLKTYGTIGMIQFETNSKGNIAEYTSQKVLRALQEAQPGTPVVEMGTMQTVLSAVNRNSLDIETIKLVAAKYGIGGLITGKLDVEKVKPSVNISTIIKELGVSAYVEATLSAKLVEAQSGATVWSNSIQGREKVASVGIMGGDIYFNAKDPEKAYGNMVKRLIRVISDDFWAHWE
jgi:hypothetical protein